MRAVSSGRSGSHSTVWSKKLQNAVAPLIEAMELRQLLSASVSGAVFPDPSGAGNVSGGNGIAGVTVYADLNNNSKLDAGEPSTTTASDGTYTLASVPSGAQIIRQVTPTGQRQSYPAQAAGNHVTVASTALTGVNFDDTTGAYVSGTVYDDANGNGKVDAGETGIAGVTVVAFSGTTVASEAVTTSSGGYAFTSLPAGTYTITDAAAAGTSAGRVTLTVSTAQVVTGQNLLNAPLVAPASTALTGTVIGTAGSYNNSGNTINKAFDGNLNNYFDGPTASGNYAGLDLGAAKVITQISYAPRPGQGGRMTGGVFQGSDSADFSGPVTTLYTVTTAPASGTFTTVNVSSALPFRYVRYLSPNGSYGDVGEIRFTGYAPVAGATLSSTGTLAVYGTNNADTILVSLNSSEYPNLTFVDLNGAPYALPVSGSKNLIVAALGGNDTVNSIYDDDSDAVQIPTTVAGGDGNDNINLDYPLLPVFVDAGAGNDTVTATGDGDATLHGGDGDDFLGSEGASHLTLAVYGDEGDDTLSLGIATGGTLYGGAGNDTLLSNDPDDNVVVSGGDGTDTYEPDGFYGNGVLSLDGKADSSLGNGVGSLQLDTDVENITVDGNNFPGGGSANTLVINGDSAANVITVDQAAENGTTINAGDGNDTIYANDGVPETIDGGAGMDTAYVDPTGDTVTNVENVIGQSSSPTPAPLTGAVIGTAGSYDNSGNTIAKAFDGNTSTFFDGQVSAGNYAGLDLGTAKVITSITFAPRVGYESRMVGGVFQGSDSADFSSNLTTLYTVTATPADGYTTVNVSSPVAFRYVRYLSPAGSHGDVAELGFSGYVPAAGAAMVGNTLAVYGTSGDDTISVNFDNEEADSFVVTVDGSQQTFSANSIDSLVVETFNGTNSVTIRGNYDYGSATALLNNISVLGGAGNDTLDSVIQDLAQSSSQSMSVSFNGEAGNDHVDVEGGDTATIDDGDGNDSFYTQAIQDTLTFNITAGNGNDSVDVGSVGGSSVQYGTVTFGTGQDSFYNSDIDDDTTLHVDGKSLTLSSATAEIIGRVLNATTGSGVAGAQVYLDNNNKGRYDAGDTSATTDSNGVYAFTQLMPSQDTSTTTYVVRLTVPTGFAVAAGSTATNTEALAPGNGVSGVDFAVAPAATGGAVSGSVTSGSKGLANVTVYLDANNDGTIDNGELTTTTDPSGNYSFTNVPAGAYVVRQVVSAGQKQTSPTNNYGDHVTVSAGSTATGENFVDTATATNTASIAGTVFDDANDNLKQDTGEAGLSGWTLYLDLNNSGSFVTGDPTTTTGSNGTYQFTDLAAGTYIVRVEPNSGYSQTTPTMNYGQHETVAVGQAVTGAVFGERQIS